MYTYAEHNPRTPTCLMNLISEHTVEESMPQVDICLLETFLAYYAEISRIANVDHTHTHIGRV